MAVATNRTANPRKNRIRTTGSKKSNPPAIVVLTHSVLTQPLDHDQQALAHSAGFVPARERGEISRKIPLKKSLCRLTDLFHREGSRSRIAAAMVADSGRPMVPLRRRRF